VRVINLVAYFKKVLWLPGWSICRTIASNDTHKLFELCSSETIRRTIKNATLAQYQTEIDPFDIQELAQAIVIIAKQLPLVANSHSRQFVDQISQNMLGFNMGHHYIL